MSRFMSRLTSEVKQNRAWTVAGLGLAVAVVVLSIALTRASSCSRIVLLPYGIATAGGAITLEDTQILNAQYLTLLALSDLKLLTDWTPTTIDLQVKRLLNRLAPAYRAATETRLRSQVEDNKAKDFKQTFYVATTQVVGNAVTLTGRLQRWKGAELDADEPMSYTVTYVATGDVPLVERFEQVAEGAR